MRGELMSGSVAPNAPNGMYCVSRLVTIGCGLVPPYGSSKPPAGSTISDRLPNGGAEALMLWRSAVGKSYEMPYEERRAVRPLPLTSHAQPTRGEKFSHCIFSPVWPPGKPASPG